MTTTALAEPPCRVVTFDGRGNGRSDRPTGAAAYGEREFAADALAVLDATGTASATLVSLSVGAQRALILAAEHPDRVAGAVFIGPSVPLASPQADSPRDLLDAVLPTDTGWPKAEFSGCAAGFAVRCW
jgi:pimeloyl-ACP methyl ester carboxylesterase